MVERPMTVPAEYGLVACVVVAMLAALGAGCRSQPAQQARQASGASPAVGWRTLGSWSGRGNGQTGSFESVSGQLRIKWRAAAAEGGRAAGTFRLTAHSAISGRPLQVAVDRRGAGEGTAYIEQDPHDFYMGIESDNLDWSFTVEEAVSGTIQGVPSPPPR